MVQMNIHLLEMLMKSYRSMNKPLYLLKKNKSSYKHVVITLTKPTLNEAEEVWVQWYRDNKVSIPDYIRHGKVHITHLPSGAVEEVEIIELYKKDMNKFGMASLLFENSDGKKD